MNVQKYLFELTILTHPHIVFPTRRVSAFEVNGVSFFLLRIRTSSANHGNIKFDSTLTRKVLHSAATYMNVA